MLKGLQQRIFLILLFPLSLLGIAAYFITFPFFLLFDPQRGFLLALAIDDMGNVMLGGKYGQTISSRAAHNQNKWWGCVLCRLLNAVQSGHCAAALTDPIQNEELK